MESDSLREADEGWDDTDQQGYQDNNVDENYREDNTDKSYCQENSTDDNYRQDNIDECSRQENNTDDNYREDNSIDENHRQEREDSPSHLIIDDYESIGDAEEEEDFNRDFRSTKEAPSKEDLRSQRTKSDTNDDLSEKPRSKGSMFGKLKLIPNDPEVDPPRSACYNCWEMKHNHRNCPDTEKRDYCHNCGRRGTTVDVCERCSEAYKTWLAARQAKQERLEKEGIAGDASSSSNIKNSETPSSTTNSNIDKRKRTRRSRNRGGKRTRIDPPTGKMSEDISRRLEQADRQHAARLGLPSGGHIDSVRRGIAQATQRIAANRAEFSPWAHNRNISSPPRPQRYQQEERDYRERQEREYRERSEQEYREQKERDFRERQETEVWATHPQRNSFMMPNTSMRDLFQRRQSLNLNGPSFGSIDKWQRQGPSNSPFESTRYPIGYPTGNSQSQFSSPGGGMQSRPIQQQHSNSTPSSGILSANDADLVRECRLLLESVSSESTTVKAPIVQAVTSLLESRLRRSLP